MGGHYVDGEVNGQGCSYVTSAHGSEYHDFSTGFRCCKAANREALGKPAHPPAAAGRDPSGMRGFVSKVGAPAQTHAS